MKAILLVRVSTDRQDFDEQEKQLYDMAIADGFSDCDIIPICEKESGIKLKEDERKGLNRMKEIINSDSVSCVYAWEVSRIGRKKKVIFSIVEFLQERGIQLIVKEPYIKLLNDDNSINEGAETVLTLFAQLAESEMRNKQSRFKRGKEANRKQGIYNGGKIPFGYRLDDNNKFVIDEDNAKIVRDIFDMYINSQLSHRGISKEMKNRGFKFNELRIRRIIHYTNYCNGEYLPKIISIDTFNKAQKRCEDSNKVSFKSENYYLARGLIRCVKCGHIYSPMKRRNTYVCSAHSRCNPEIGYCDNKLSIAIHILDSILWEVAKNDNIMWSVLKSDENKKDIQERIDVLNSKILTSQSVIDNVESKRDRIIESYIEGNITKDKRDSMLKSLDNSLVESKESLARYNAELTHLIDILGTLGSQDIHSINQYHKSLENGSIDALKQMFDMVHKFINKVWLFDKYNNLKVIAVKASIGIQFFYAIGRGDSVRFFKHKNKALEETLLLSDLFLKPQMNDLEEINLYIVKRLPRL